MKTEGKTAIWLIFYQLVIIVVRPSFPILFPLPTTIYSSSSSLSDEIIPLPPSIND
jgi:hypothetical protein